MGLLEEGKSELVQSIGDMLTERFGPMICPISAIWQGRPVQCGTGTLFRIGDRHFLISAAHVVETMNKAGAWAFTGDFVADGSVVPRVRLNGSRASLMVGNHDLAMIELAPEFLAKIPNRRFLTLLDFAYDRPGEGDEYMVFGFPAELSNATDEDVLQQTGILFPTTCVPVGDRLLENYESRIHLLFNLPRNVTDQDGMAMPKSLEGISGCAVWRFLRGTVQKFDIEAVRMIGIETHVYKASNLIRATIWGAVLTVLWVNYQDVRPAMELHLPPDQIDHFRKLTECRVGE